MNTTVAPDSSPEQVQLMARLRRMMMIAGVTTSVAIAVLLVAIGYRLFKGEGSAASGPDITAVLPKGARIVATAAAGDRLAVTVDIGGATEIRTFDAKTLKPTGRLRFAVEP
ncbi:conserved hypothetical protein [Bradyrhizobium sp. STM 3843]|uniref:hypothetical protein n=1 Tax=Bradyrhizobium sp. STM 3843 TaxID=551947 RepID=UPI000240493D|nr:hypothetical protein [Bradyrhizobium sp. STM 3843]CCE08064.1 conserved hypothetical protein [Bradyrhizobium sp. STM 3843]